MQDGQDGAQADAQFEQRGKGYAVGAIAPALISEELPLFEQDGCLDAPDELVLDAAQ
jgi:hypothetical protein